MRLRRALAVFVVLVLFVHVGLTILHLWHDLRPQSREESPVVRATAVLYAQNWRLFAPEISPAEVQLQFSCRDEGHHTQWFAPEERELEHARAFRLHPAIRTIHAWRTRAVIIWNHLESVASIAQLKDDPSLDEVAHAVTPWCRSFLAQSRRVQMRIVLEDLRSRQSQTTWLGEWALLP